MGPIPLGVGPPRYFLDLYIPSYTSLSALIDSHKPKSQINKKPSILLVVKPDAQDCCVLQLESTSTQSVCIRLLL